MVIYNLVHYTNIRWMPSHICQALSVRRKCNLSPTSQVLWYFKYINFVSIVVEFYDFIDSICLSMFHRHGPHSRLSSCTKHGLTNLKRLLHLFSHDTLVLRLFPWLEPCYRVSLARLLENVILRLRPFQYRFMM